MFQTLTIKIQRRFNAEDYPRQFWLIFWGMMISTIGSSMIWPFMMIYASGKLALSLTLVASLMTVSSIMGLVSSFIAGPLIDRLGRKWIMAISLLLNACGYFILSQATTLPGFMLGMAVNGTFNPLYRIGADAMLADLIPAEKRVNAYSLMRMANNVGVALGPAIGGFIATVSYTIAFYCASAGLACFSLLITFFAVETLPARVLHAASGSQPKPSVDRGYSRVLRDRHFLLFCGLFTLVQMCAALIWVLLSVYTKTNFGIPESAYGLLPTTNALMVVFLQLIISTITRRYPSLRMMTLGAMIYATATFSIAFDSTYAAFWLSMVVMTLGELILVPTSSTYVANLAPAEMRGRYMSIYGLTWGVAAGISPVVGGFLSDTLGTRAPWIAGGIIGLAAVIGFFLLARFSSSPKAVPETA